MTTPWVVGPLPDQTISYGDAIDRVIEYGGLDPNPGDLGMSRLKVR